MLTDRSGGNSCLGILAAIDERVFAQANIDSCIYEIPGCDPKRTIIDHAATVALT